MTKNKLEHVVLPSTCHLYLGDCLEVMSRSRSTGVAMLFADLPYGLNGTSFDWDKCINLQDLWKHVKSILKENAICCFTATQPFSSHLVLSNLKKFRYSYVWTKNRATNFLNAKTQPLRNHEDILIFAKGKATYTPQMKKGAPYSISRKPSVSMHLYPASKSKSTTKNTGIRFPTSTQNFNLDKKNLHPTQKPVALLEWLIKTYTNPGDTVLDPTFGSCTTGVACARLGRSFIGIEKDPKYFRIGKERVEKERTRLGLSPIA